MSIADTKLTPTGNPDRMIKDLSAGPLKAFGLRILLIHDYRRILLKDPGLAKDLMPTDWRGLTARNLCAAIYKELVGPAEDFLDTTLESISQGAVSRDTLLNRRFSQPDGQPA